jgi:hypothetical protein
MDFDKILDEMEQPTKPLSRVAGRNYVYKSPSSVRITRKDRQTLLKQTDPAQVKAAMEVAFNQIIAAANGTKVQQLVISKLNQLRNQVFDRLDS